MREDFLRTSEEIEYNYCCTRFFDRREKKPKDLCRVGERSEPPRDNKGFELASDRLINICVYMLLKWLVLYI